MSKLIAPSVCKISLLLTVLVGSASVEAAPTIQVGGVTALQLSPNFLDALVAGALTLKATDRAVLRRNQAVFPITGGVIDLGSFAAELAHLGGLSITRGKRRVELFNFTIDTTGEVPKLTGLATLNGDLLGRLHLFDLELTRDPFEYKQFLVLGGVRATFSAAAATTLRQALGVNVFFEGLEIGVARLATVAL